MQRSLQHPSGRAPHHTHQLLLFLHGRLVLIAPVDGDVIHPGQDPGHLAVLPLPQHLLPEDVSIGPQPVLLPDGRNLKQGGWGGYETVK